MRRAIVSAALFGTLAVASLAGGTLFFVERPTNVRVAVSDKDQADVELLTSASRVVRHGRQPIRFKVTHYPSEREVADALDSGRVDMAVVRTDQTIPANGQTVVILHRDAAILAVPDGSDIKDVADLAGKVVGIVNGPAVNRGLLDAVLVQYGIALDKVTSRSVPQDQIAAALKDKTVAAILVVGTIADAQVQSAIKAVAAAGEGAPHFIEIEDAEAMAQRSPAYDSLEVAKGAFRGSPPSPDDSFDTLAVTYRLMASSAMSESVVADVTRFFLSERGALTAIDARAQRIEAPSTDKGVALPVHPGSADYIDDEEESFLDQYSDYLYLGAMLVGVLASGATAMFSRINAQGAQAVDQLTARLIEILRLVRFAPTIDLVNAFEAETDEIVASALDADVSRGLDDRRLGTLALALDQVRDAIRDRRSVLGGEPSPSGTAPRLRSVPALEID